MLSLLRRPLSSVPIRQAALHAMQRLPRCRRNDSNVPYIPVHVKWLPVYLFIVQSSSSSEDFLWPYVLSPRFLAEITCDAAAALLPKDLCGPTTEALLNVLKSLWCSVDDDSIGGNEMQLYMVCTRVRKGINGRFSHSLELYSKRQQKHRLSRLESLR